MWHCLRKGAATGALAGLATACTDTLFLLLPDAATPPFFPFAILFNNVVLWTALGCIAGMCIATLPSNKWQNTPSRMLWVLFFLLPFVLLYGIAGKSYFPTIPFHFHNFPPPAFDRGAAIFIACFFAIAIAVYARKYPHQSENLVPEVCFLSIFYYISGNFTFISNRAIYLASKTIELPPEGKIWLAVLLYCLFAIFCAAILAAMLSLRIHRPRLFSTGRSILILALLWCAASSIIIFKGISPPDPHIPQAHDSSADHDDPPVFLIILDALRADRLQLYGGPVATPNLELFARDSLLCADAISPASYTLPSHASLFTGLFICQHHTEGDPRKTWPNFTLPILTDEHITLAELFHDAGYFTAAISSNYGFLSPRHNMNQGFAYYDTTPNIGISYSRYAFRPIIHLVAYLTGIYPKAMLSYRPADEIVREATSLLSQNLDGSPIFLFLNFMEPHGPYRPPRPFSGRYADTAFPQMQRLALYRDFLKQRHDKDQWDSFLLSQYDGEVTYLDSQLGVFLDFLKENNLYDRAMIVITSDHGEMFGEHGLYEHSTYLYEEIIKIPMLIKYPYSRRAGRIEHLVNLTDIYATIAKECKLPVNHPVSSYPIGPENKTVPMAEYYMELVGEHRAYYSGDYKLMVYQKGRPNELFNIKDDPREQHNLIGVQYDEFANIKEKLQIWLDENSIERDLVIRKTKSMDDESLQQLRSLGYFQ
jgi:arylsulfatase A-like enzyme